MPRGAGCRCDFHVVVVLDGLADVVGVETSIKPMQLRLPRSTKGCRMKVRMAQGRGGKGEGVFAHSRASLKMRGRSRSRSGTSATMRKATARPAGLRLMTQHSTKRPSWRPVYSEMRRLRSPLKRTSNSALTRDDHDGRSEAEETRIAGRPHKRTSLGRDDHESALEERGAHNALVADKEKDTVDSRLCTVGHEEA